MSHTITKEYRCEIAHRLINYNGKCAHLHGHSYVFELAVRGELDQRAMVADYADIKAAMKEVLEPYDHACILHSHDPLVMAKELQTSTDGSISRLFVWACNPTAEAMAHAFGSTLQSKLKPLQVVSFTVRETVTSSAVWTP